MPKRGPKKKATALNVLAGSRRERAPTTNGRATIRGRIGARLTAPESVKPDGIARHYFNWLVDTLTRAGVAEPLDRTVIEHMALDYAEERRALQKCAEQGRVLISAASGNSYINPHWSIMVAARKRIDSRLADLGMTPRARQSMQFDRVATRGGPDLLSFARSRDTQFRE